MKLEPVSAIDLMDKPRVDWSVYYDLDGSYVQGPFPDEDEARRCAQAMAEFGALVWIQRTTLRVVMDVERVDWSPTVPPDHAS